MRASARASRPGIVNVGFVAPFVQPDLVWDFQLPRVVSIQTSGHKYGLVYPGVGWVLWRDAEHLPEDLVFQVNYLGGDMPTFALNFSRPGAQVVLQYFQFLRLGRDGFRLVQRTCQDVAMHIAAMKPVALASSEVPAALIEKERNVATAKAAESGKPADIAAKMIEGSVQKYLKEVSLLNQPFVKNDKQTVEQMLKAASTTVKGFTLYVVGEGIENMAQRETLLQLGCDYGQGYLLGRPAPMDTFITG